MAVDAILAQPLQPDPSRKCPRCGRWRALELIRDEKIEGVLSYRCRSCLKVTRYALRHPPDAV